MPSPDVPGSIVSMTEVSKEERYLVFQRKPKGLRQKHEPHLIAGCTLAAQYGVHGLVPEARNKWLAVNGKSKARVNPDATASRLGNLLVDLVAQLSVIAAYLALLMGIKASVVCNEKACWALAVPQANSTLRCCHIAIGAELARGGASRVLEQRRIANVTKS